MTLLEVLAALNAKGSPFVVPIEPDEVPERSEDVTEMSDIEYHGQFERFSHGSL